MEEGEEEMEEESYQFHLPAAGGGDDAGSAAPMGADVLSQVAAGGFEGLGRKHIFARIKHIQLMDGNV